MPYIADRVKDTTTTSGTGTVTLANSAPTGYRTFGSVFTSAARVGYVIDDGAGAWEVGKGVFDPAGPNTLTRDTVRASSNSNALVSFSGATKDVWIDASAELVDNANVGQIIAVGRGLTIT